MRLGEENRRSLLLAINFGSVFINILLILNLSSGRQRVI